MVKYSIVIPAHNEEQYIRITLNSLVNQTVLPYQIIVVDDHSTDRTAEIVQEYTTAYAFVKLLQVKSTNEHQPGSKVILAFEKGYKLLDKLFDVIVKLDADLDLPTDYFEQILKVFEQNEKVGMVGGHAYIEKNGEWKLESLTDKDHIRGAFKAYRKETFDAIGGLKPQMGWDTVDELLAKYNGWEVKTIPTLKVKHLKPTGANYNKGALQKQGEAYYTLGYGLMISMIAAAKLAVNKGKISYFFGYMKGYLMAAKKRIPKMVDKKQEQFIRHYRWKNIRKKIKNLIICSNALLFFCVSKFH
ncbi:glycosyltransferase family 2 protein [Vaginella massiliensis]|uniref:glycosyltransferase family 2 protein n=1 Tax=Vaginella massiliensis TaxID=1816680 RepID=UPI000AAE35E2|nr:glycosyltransferase family 2 protein [Vaginella massiliensis]